MTFTLLGHDDGGLLGIVTATCTPAVGDLVPALRAGIGAAASQAWTNESLRGVMLDALDAGSSVADAVRIAHDVDPDPGLRQFAVMDAQGTYATHTGSSTTPWAGTSHGRSCVAIGNYLSGREVVTAMTDAFDSDARSLPERLAGALVAGDAAGGDRRGRRSAALLFTSPAGDVVSVRVDDDPNAPLALARLVTAL